MRHARALAMSTVAILAAVATTTTAQGQGNGAPEREKSRVMAAHTVHTGPTVSIPPGQPAIAPPATCPSGEVASGGGFETSGTSVFPTWSRLQPGSSSAWQVRGFNAGNTTERINAVVVCTTAPHSNHSGSVSLNPGDSGLANGPCADGQVASGGGFFSTSDLVRINSSINQASTWSASGVNQAATAQTLTALGICPTVPHHTAFRRGPVAAGSTAELTVACPAGEVVTGGGGSGPNSTFLRDSAPSGNGWRIRSSNTSDITNTLTVIAVCTTL